MIYYGNGFGPVCILAVVAIVLVIAGLVMDKATDIVDKKKAKKAKELEELERARRKKQMEALKRARGSKG